ncbi:MAG TPA: DinB family protein [Longimicrobium sp.]|nr:DinB family protein [Longimicrobium sp.]
MTASLDATLEILERTPAVVDALLRGTSPSWHRLDEGPETWSPIAVVGHLIHADEANWMPRAQTILEHGADRPINAFDRFGHLARFGDWPLDGLLDRFAELRRTQLQVLRGWRLGDEQMALTGRHPELGIVTLRQLLSTWAVHDLAHLGQITRVMARGYTEEVGPWRQYLSILAR